ncbi:hypothetical protein [Methylomonas sp. DH-1]|uniref:hypothetical protein n=2 Tax=Methylomonas TaxID=416 RepID=UPI0012F6303E|nr:hypothetical protein [Methylomonas sp. DH-1]
MSRFAKNKIFILFISVPLFFSAAICSPRFVEISDVMSEQLNKNELAAYALAFGLFSDRIRNDYIGEDIQKYGENSYSVYAANKNNYTVAVERSNKWPDKFWVEFRLKPSERFGFIMGSGGVLRYLVDINKNSAELKTKYK